ncbi:MAG: hypothetical protein ABH812_00475 [bacterium]
MAITERPVGLELTPLVPPISILKDRIQELALRGKEPIVQASTKWGQIDLVDGFRVVNKAMFFPKKTLGDFDNNKTIEEDPSKSDTEKIILLREIHSVGTEDTEDRVVFSYLINFVEGENPTIMMFLKNLVAIDATQIVSMRLPEVKDSLPTLIYTGDFPYIDSHTFMLSQESERSREFIEKLIKTLQDENLELIQDEALPDSEISE